MRQIWQGATNKYGAADPDGACLATYCERGFFGAISLATLMVTK